MRHAPPVGVSCSGGGFWRAAQVLLPALAAAAVAAWLGLLADMRPQWACGLAGACALAAAALALRLSRPRPALLQWDGARWAVDSVPGRVAVMLDAGGWMLLRFDADAAAGAAGVRWLPVPAAAPPLRAALYARDAVPGAVPGLPRGR